MARRFTTWQSRPTTRQSRPRPSGPGSPGPRPCAGGPAAVLLLALQSLSVARRPEWLSGRASDFKSEGPWFNFWPGAPAGRKTWVKNPAHIPGAERRKTLQTCCCCLSLENIVAPSHKPSGKKWREGKKDPPMKPRPNNGRRVVSSDVREYKIGIRGGKRRHLTYRVAKSGFSLQGEQSVPSLKAMPQKALMCSCV